MPGAVRRGPRYPRLSDMDLSLFFAGTAGSVPTARRGLPAVVVRRGGDRLLFDCGEGTQRQLVRSIGLPDLDRVFLTHLHIDHWLGLIGMLKSFDLRDREAPLAVHGPRGTSALMGAMRRIYGRLDYPFAVTELGPGDAVELDDYTITALEAQHRGTALAYAIVEVTRPGHLDSDLAQRLGVPFGPELGRLQRGETVNGVTPEQVMGPARPGRKVVLSGDTAPCEMVAIAAHEADVLVHEATFGHEELGRAQQTGHSTATQAAELARDAGVRMLALTHISPRYGGGELRDEARAIFPSTEVPRDFDTIEIPFAEKGEPELIRWPGQATEAAAVAP
jgi:ribonuclease Z